MIKLRGRSSQYPLFPNKSSPFTYAGPHNSVFTSAHTPCLDLWRKHPRLPPHCMWRELSLEVTAVPWVTGAAEASDRTVFDTATQTGFELDGGGRKLKSKQTKLKRIAAIFTLPTHPAPPHKLQQILAALSLEAADTQLRWPLRAAM